MWPDRSKYITREETNPIIEPADIPGATAIFNPGVTKIGDTYVMITRTEDDGEVKIYYGASDACVGLAYTTVDKLLDFLTEYRD